VLTSSNGIGCVRHAHGLQRQQTLQDAEERELIVTECVSRKQFEQGRTAGVDEDELAVTARHP